MTYLGIVQNGVVVLPPEARLPEGAEVKVDIVEAAPEPELLTPENDPLLAALRKAAKPRPH